MGCYVHQVPGRLRVKIPSVKNNPGKASDVRRILEQIEGIDSTAVNTITGSIVIHYDSRAVDSGAILDALKFKGLYDGSKPAATDDPIQATFSKVGAAVGKVFLGFVLEKTFEGSPLALLTVLI